jgi:hypothetical protein
MSTADPRYQEIMRKWRQEQAENRGERVKNTGAETTTNVDPYDPYTQVDATRENKSGVGEMGMDGETGVQSMGEQQQQGERKRKTGKREKAREWFRGVGF